MHHGTCVTHVPWCMLWSLTNGFLLSRWRGIRSRHSRRMDNSQFYVSGKRSIHSTLLVLMRGTHQWPMDFPHKGQWFGVCSFLWCLPEQAVDKTTKLPLIWDVTALMWRYCNGLSHKETPIYDTKHHCYVFSRFNVLTEGRCTCTWLKWGDKMSTFLYLLSYVQICPHQIWFIYPAYYNFAMFEWMYRDSL